jgi:hypothetical protein
MAQASPTPAVGKGTNESAPERLMSAQDLLYAAKMHRPGNRKPSGRSGQSHLAGGASRPGVKRGPKGVQGLG